MKNKFFLLIFSLLLTYYSGFNNIIRYFHYCSNDLLHAAENNDPANKINNPDKLKSDVISPGENDLLKVTVIIILIWISLALYINVVDRKVKKLEKEISEMGKN